MTFFATHRLAIVCAVCAVAGVCWFCELIVRGGRYRP